jgi:hypothetical protein
VWGIGFRTIGFALLRVSRGVVSRPNGTCVERSPAREGAGG